MSIHGSVPTTSSPRATSPGAVGSTTAATPPRAPSGPVAVRVRSLTRSYRAGVVGCSARVDAIRGVDLDIECGTVLGLLGPPGSGKSTLLLCIAGLLKPDSGSIAWFGRPSDADGGRPPGLAYVPDRSAHHSFMTVREAVEYHALMRGGAGRLSGADIDRALAGAALFDLASSRISTLPWAANPQLAIAQALAAAPRLLMLDETLDGVAPGVRRDITRGLRDLAASGVSVVVAARTYEAIRSLADRIAIMDQGRLSAPVDASAIDQSPVLELTVAAPAVAQRLLGARVAEEARDREVWRVPLDGTTAEAILSRCHACGIRVAASRVVMGGPGD